MSCVFRKKSKRENTPWKLVARLRGKTGRGEKLASGKTHSVGVGREKQARKPTLEAYR